MLKAIKVLVIFNSIEAIVKLTYATNHKLPCHVSTKFTHKVYDMYSFQPMETTVT